MKIIQRKLGKGFTLLETLLVVGFISLACIGLYTTAKFANTLINANLEASRLKALGDVLVGSYGVIGDYSTLTTAVVASNPSLLPTGMVDSSTGNLVNEFGGTIQIQQAPALTNLSGVVLQGFTIVDNDIDQKSLH